MVTTNIASIGKKFVTDKVGSVNGGRFGLSSSQLLDPFKSSMAGTADSNSSMIKYPEDLTGAPDQGHFILFFINQQTVGKLKHEKGGKSTVSSENNEQSQRNKPIQNKSRNPSTGGTSTLMSATAEDKSKIRDSNKTENSSGGIFTLQRAPTKRMDTCIALYMPQTVDVTYSAGYEEKEIGALAQTGVAAFDAFKKGGINAAVDSIKSKAPELVDEALFNAVDTIAPGAKAIAFAKSGKVISNRMELIFSGVGKRTFSYTFKFLPRSRMESKNVKLIVDKFKYHMLPQVEGDPGSSRTFVTPDTFDIEYRWVGNSESNKYLNKVSTCVLTDMSVKYGGNVGYQAFEPDEKGDTPPAETEITLSFKELEIITKQRASEGF